MKIRMYLALGILLSMAHMILPATACTQGSDCLLPDCFCSTFDHPDFTDVKDIPQMVYFGFDDALTTEVDRFYQQVFTNTRLNPNGCPITMSLYVQNQYTDYSLVEKHFQRGDEIGSHSVNHINVDTAELLQFEAGQQKENLINNGHVARDQVVGWRSPNLQTAGDVQPDVLKALNYTYDISLTYVRQSNNRIPWPYTLDFGYPYTCSIPSCPGAQVSHPGFWEIPVFSLLDSESGFPCAYVDSCRPSSENAAFNYLWSNFEKVYNDNRAPFGLNMHAAWFFFDDYIKATHTFVERLLQLDDVYIISGKKVLDWMRNPVKVSEIPTKMPSWGCSNPVPRSSALQRTTKLSNLVPSTTPVVTSTAGPATTTEGNGKARTAATTPLPVDVPVGNDSCVQGVNCVLPSCQCRSVDPPGQLSPDNTPQIVYFTVSGRVDVLTYQPLLKLLGNGQNPNNCSVSSTVFVPTTGNSVPYLQGLLSRRHEVAMYGKEGYKYTPTPSVEEQVAEQLMQFAAQTSDIQLKPNDGAVNRGWRSPLDSVLNDELLTALVKGGVQYDSSVTIGRSRPYKDVIPWPYTLDFGFQDVCSGSQNQCPVKSSSATALKMEIKLIVLIVLNVVYVVHGVIPSDCTQGVNCMLPECFCATFDHPNRTAKFPQIVYFAIDDALTVTVDKPYQRLFNDSRTNPNGCPITFSLFVQDQYTSYNLVENYSQRGHEIGCHGVNHTNVDTASNLRFEAGLQKENVITKGHVSRNQVVGWRSPNLKTAGDAQPDVLKELNYTYDISLTYPRQADNRVPFPFTLDYGYPYSCSIPPCPDLQSSHPGFWEVPVFSLRNPETGYECAYVDSCRPSSEAAALNYLWSNFLQVFNDNRAPFGLNMHGAWFLYSDDYFNAADTFIKKLLEMDDVYIVSVEKTLDWMRNPVEISDIQEKLPSWGCQNPTQATAVQ